MDDSPVEAPPRVVTLNPGDVQFYLERLKETGQRGLAADSIQQTTESFDYWLKGNDPYGEVAKAADWAERLYSENIVRTLERQAVEGVKKEIKNKDGDVVAVDVRYETGLRAVVLKGHSERYNDKLEVKTDGNSGVLALPMPVDDVAAWGKLMAGRVKKK